jgi:5'-AMP-activated protein kinase regulatory beta subunit
MAKGTKQSGRKTAQITCRASDAQQVFAAGTFNDWSTTATPLKKSDDGEWKAELQLLPGRYEYKLLVDGNWCCEPGCDGPHTGCPGCMPNPFGTMNRIVEVK